MFDMHFVFETTDKTVAEQMMSEIDGKAGRLKAAPVRERKSTVYIFVRNFSYRCDRAVAMLKNTEDITAPYRAAVVNGSGKLYQFKDSASEGMFERKSERVTDKDILPAISDAFSLVGELSEDGKAEKTLTKNDVLK